MHFDADLGRYSLAAGLERFASMFLYLSDVEEGGETIFPEADDSTYRRGVSCGLVDQGTRTVSNDCTREEEGHMVANCAERAPGLVVPPKRGSLMLWYNYDEEGKANTRAIHAGSCLRTISPPKSIEAAAPDQLTFGCAQDATCAAGRSGRQTSG